MRKLNKYGYFLICLAFLLGLLGYSTFNSRTSYDSELFLRKISHDFSLKPLTTRRFDLDDKYFLGRALFFDPILSGNRDIACATCHLWTRGTTDAVSLAMGTKSIGLGEMRRLTENRTFVPRHSMDLWNRDNNAVKSMFWDGRVEALDSVPRIFRSPLGKDLPTGLENAMAVQALFPLVRHDEMLGEYGDRSPTDLPIQHADLPNELITQPAYSSESVRMTSVHQAIMKRLLGRNEVVLLDWQKAYQELFGSAYPNKSIEEMSIVDLGNAIAHYEELAFATRNTPWDHYLEGQSDAISEEAKQGAIIFYGKGKCSVCHSGALFSDFEFHALAVPHVGPGIDNSGEDLGRYHATGNPNDKYKFRTPPLRNATVTQPYFHNGSARTLDQVIRQHMNPLIRADKYREDGGFAMSREEINAVSPILAEGTVLSDQEVKYLIDFLGALEDSPIEDLVQYIIPESVPSGLPIDQPEALLVN